MTDMEMQVLRSIDKHDNIGTAGVVVLLQKPSEEFGASLDPVRAGLIGQFLDLRGRDNTETLANLRVFFPHAAQVMRRLKLMVWLDETEASLGITKWDELLAMPTNSDETWTNGGRPKNIGFALDDMVDAIVQGHTEQREWARNAEERI